MLSLGLRPRLPFGTLTSNRLNFRLLFLVNQIADRAVNLGDLAIRANRVKAIKINRVYR